MQCLADRMNHYCQWRKAGKPLLCCRKKLYKGIYPVLVCQNVQILYKTSPLSFFLLQEVCFVGEHPTWLAMKEREQAYKRGVFSWRCWSHSPCCTLEGLVQSESLITVLVQLIRILFPDMLVVLIKSVSSPMSNPGWYRISHSVWYYYRNSSHKWCS